MGLRHTGTVRSITRGNMFCLKVRHHSLLTMLTRLRYVWVLDYLGSGNSCQIAKFMCLTGCSPACFPGEKVLEFIDMPGEVKDAWIVGLHVCLYMTLQPSVFDLEFLFLAFLLVFLLTHFIYLRIDILKIDCGFWIRQHTFLTFNSCVDEWTEDT